MKSLIKGLTLVLVFILVGCNSESISDEVGSKSQEDVDQTPSDKIEEIVEEEDTIFYLTPISTNAAYSVSEGVIYGDSLDDTGSIVFSNVEVSKPLSEWSIELEINHPYNSWLCIELDNDYFLTGYYRKGKWSWSDLIPECSYMLGLPYTYDEVLTMYGDIEAKQGNNFTLHLMRERNWSVKWFIQ